jgi:SAM-dependent methyltransferase
MGVVGVAAGLGFLVYAPSLKVVSSSLFLFAGFHIVGAIVLLASAYSLGLRRLLTRRLARRSERARSFDFGWGPEWMNGLAIIALAFVWAAIAVEFAAAAWWPLAFLLLLLGASAFAGNLVMRSFRSADHVVLPMVDLVRGDDDLILDAGCGAGRTTIALRRGLRNGRVVAVDRFDADYIDGGGRDLIARNLAAAGLSDRVTVEAADLTSLPFKDATFDGAVSTNVFDHLGADKPRALREAFRVLKPGARFLMAVWVPGWPMFAVANVFSLFLTSRADWRRMASEAGFAVADEGVFNYAWFALLQKPGA